MGSHSRERMRARPQWKYASVTFTTSASSGSLASVRILASTSGSSVG